MPITLDSIDIKILNILQENARISNAELSAQVNLSQTPCLRRLRKLEQSGLIQQYTVRLDYKKLGYGISALTFVRLEKNTACNGTEFEAAVSKFPQVIECLVLAGAHDYVLRVMTESLESYEHFLKEDLANVDKVVGVESTIILNQVMCRHSPELGRLQEDV